MVIRCIVYIVIFLLPLQFVCSANHEGAKEFRLMAHEKSLDHYPISYLRQIADTIVSNQFPSGGWSKDQEWHIVPVSKKEILDRKNHRKAMLRDGVGSTIDNGATTSELLFLCKVYHLSPDLRYRTAAIRAIEYLLNSQYSCGGWPQFWPSRTKDCDRPFYSDHITFNDKAMINVLKELRSISENKYPYSCLNIDLNTQKRCKIALQKGIQCILDLQVRIDGKPTVWCQQYDELTMKPASARSFESPGLCGTIETVNILIFLMSIPQPSLEIVNSVTFAVDWLKCHSIKGWKVERYKNSEGKLDRRLVKSPNSELWARFYTLDTQKPFFSDYDRKIYYDFSKISYERRNGYSWLDDKPLVVIKRFQKWKNEVMAE